MPRAKKKVKDMKYVEDEGGLVVKMDNLLISKQVHAPPPAPPIVATSEFYYYILDCGTAEKNYKIHCTKSNEMILNPRKHKMEERKIQKLETVEGKLKNLTITAKNEKSIQKQQSPAKKAKKDESNELFLQMRQLQQGTMKLSSLPASNHLKFKADSQKTKEDIQRNRKEIFEINRQIHSKISNQIKPRLLDILQHTEPKPSNNERSQNKLPQLQVTIAIKKTKLLSGIEIYRYSSAQLYQLNRFSTWEFVPRLLKLGICKTSLSPDESLLLSLIELSNEDRQKLILDIAERKKFIVRDGNEFKFSCIAFEPQMISKPENVPIQRELKEPEVDYVDRFRLIAKNDDELNELIYQHEFISLFESELREKDLRDQSHANILQHLIETNKAYIVEGEIRVNSKNNQEAYVSHRKGMKDICVNRLILRKHAFHGDFVRVLVKRNSGNDEDLLNDSIKSSDNAEDDDMLEAIQLDECVPANRNFGCVLEILQKRHSRRVIGTFAPIVNIKKNRKFLMVNVRDQKVPNVRVDTRQIPTDVAFTDQLLLTIEIIGWNHDLPLGKVISIIGKKGELKTENTAILQQNNLDARPFEQSILDSLPTEITTNDFENRMDLRKKCIFSIDPDSARDLDDALSCEVLPNGNLEIGVHISDVSYFVREDSDLDLIVKEKATTIYLVDAVYHMLPEQLCLLCSLLPGADKLAYSVIFEMNPETAMIYNTRFTRSIVNSCAKLSYDHAQKVIEKKDKNWSELKDEFPEILNGFDVNDIAEIILKLQELAVVMRKSRKDNGSLKIDQPKLAFRFEKDDQRMEVPIDYFKYPIKDSNRLIEEFMLLANISVAAFIKEKYPEISLLRHHASPNENGLKKLVNNLNKHGVALETSSSKSISESMENIVASAKCPMAMNAAINHLVSRTMTRANYFCSGFAEKAEDFWHYALSIPIYTHFTSPIRRYADILVHRVLNAALNYDEVPSRKPEEIQMCASICNAQKQNAKLAGDDSSNLYFTHFVQSLQSKTMYAAVLGIYDYNMEVILIDTGHAIKVYYKNLQQSDKDLIIKTFVDNSPPHLTIHQYSPDARVKSSMKLEFGSEILVKLEVVKEKLVINKIYFNPTK